MTKDKRSNNPVYTCINVHVATTEHWCMFMRDYWNFCPWSSASTLAGRPPANIAVVVMFAGSVGRRHQGVQCLNDPVSLT